ncbi:hypothetical protein RI129_004507 [Pyrocoelia pectoralis]|uniref:F-box domain-containing protein n=1 Tax=Pyrocoelia pectoralis TaxID=417401 RepID=A0AAN7ZQC2_9COLE
MDRLNANQYQNLHNTSHTYCRLISTGYHNLPVDVLVRIFQNLNENELRKTVMLVCRQWKLAATRPVLQKKFYIHGKNVPTNFICLRIRDFSYLSTIYIKQILEPIIVVRQITRWLPNLKHFTLKKCGTLPELALRNLIHRCPKIETFDIAGTRFKGCKFYEEIAGLVNLKNINLSRNTFMNIHNFMSILVNCHKLEELKITALQNDEVGGQLSDAHVLFIMSNCSNTLTALGLDASNLTDFSFKVVMQCSKLKYLRLHSARNLSPNVFSSIWENLPNLNTLTVREADQINGSIIADVFNLGKENLRNITSIDFTGCWKIDNVGIIAIANCCFKLERLKLKSCKSVKSLQPIKDNCRKLKILSIAFCINLDPLTILPLPEDLNTLILDKNARFLPILNALLENDRVKIKMCLSEYSKNTENLSYD